MASSNPFDLLGDDVEDPSQIAVALTQKVTKSASVTVKPTKAGQLPTKPPPPSQAVRESKNAPSGGRGRGDGGRGGGRGRGDGGYRNRDGPPRNENGGGYNRPTEQGSGGRQAGSLGGYGGGRGRHGGESGDGERAPRRFYERRSGTGRGNGLKREGGGRGNWGTTEDDIPPPVTEETVTDVEKSPVVEKEGGEDEATDANKETPAGEQEEKEPEVKEMSLEEYEKILAEKKKALQGPPVEGRKVDTKVFETMQQLSNKKNNNEIFIKLGSEKNKLKDASEKEEKAKKSVSINEFLKPADGERGGYRGRGGRGGRGPRGGGVNGGGNQKYAAPAIADTAQFPSLGK